jgi:hypothetical protein
LLLAAPLAALMPGAMAEPMKLRPNAADTANVRAWLTNQEFSDAGRTMDSQVRFKDYFRRPRMGCLH